MSRRVNQRKYCKKDYGTNDRASLAEIRTSYYLLIKNDFNERKAWNIVHSTSPKKRILKIELFEYQEQLVFEMNKLCKTPPLQNTALIKPTITV